MIRSTPELLDLERRIARDRAVTYDRALEIFEALWREALVLNPGFNGTRNMDLTADFAVARALNGLPPDA